ncbi:Serine carboxypeptidase-like 18 [Camellia lanceoleosa]|uniref:Serine carboxypeptidase-like 18 n=1 Tax=Camellia lanceoleosa TaxID=1840588 RepID=A0ACC0IQA6_9ERIC|nr:Serine carboxypeptidase-like 18 [Camellia lanceoleosa]
MAPQAKVEHQQRLIKMSLCIFLVLALSSVAASQSLVKYLPGFDGELPFNLETGYIGIGDTDDVQLFYYFIESERDPVTDPLVLWLTGGPGCSGFSALVYEIGPLLFDVESWTGQLPSLRVNKYSWTKVANIIFIDQPVGTGFSYARTSAGYNTSDTKSVAQVYSFLRKWLVYHPQFQTNPLYIGGDSYSGITVPLLVQTILDGLDEGLEPLMGLQGYLLGNPVTDSYIDDNSRIPYVHRVNLISDELYEDAKLYCHGDYVNVQFNNSLCVTALLAIKHCLLQINLAQILEPQCAFSSPRRMEIEWDLRVREAETIEYLDSLNKLPKLTCRSFSYMLSHKWANDKAVQKALNVREGTMNYTSWMRCAKTLPFYTEDVSSTIDYHKNFTKTGLRALVYSGDHDISVPYIGTLEWINSLGVPIFDQWRAWFVDGQIAGYTQKYMNDNYRLAYATLKGAGHTAPEFKSKEALNLVDRWFAYYPI